MQSAPDVRPELMQRWWTDVSGVSDWMWCWCGDTNGCICEHGCDLWVWAEAGQQRLMLNILYWVWWMTSSSADFTPFSHTDAVSCFTVTADIMRFTLNMRGLNLTHVQLHANSHEILIRLEQKQKHTREAKLSVNDSFTQSSAAAW